MNGKFNWYVVGQTVVAGTALAGILFAFSVSTRITKLESATDEEQKGYNIALGAMTKRLDSMEAWQIRMENKMDQLLQKAHTHGGN